MGPSGAGKSTLLHIIGMHDSAWTGEYYFVGQPVHRARARRTAPQLHKQHIGFVFQSYHLLDHLTVYENLDVPLSYRDVKKAERDSIVCDMLDRFADRRQEGPLPEPALRRPAAARRRRARGHRQPEGDPRRRADRQPALEPGPRDHGAVQEAERRRARRSSRSRTRKRTRPTAAGSFTCATAGLSTNSQEREVRSSRANEKGRAQCGPFISSS